MELEHICMRLWLFSLKELLPQSIPLRYFALYLCISKRGIGVILYMNERVVDGCFI